MHSFGNLYRNSQEGSTSWLWVSESRSLSASSWECWRAQYSGGRLCEHCISIGVRTELAMLNKRTWIQLEKCGVSHFPPLLHTQNKVHSLTSLQCLLWSPSPSLWGRVSQLVLVHQSSSLLCFSKRGARQQYLIMRRRSIVLKTKSSTR